MPRLVDVLSSYVPLIVQQRVEKDPRPLEAPEVHRYHGALLFLDISGFTALAEALAQEGREGAEKLTRVLTAYFERLITTIVEYGGDVLNLAGDGILAMWEAEMDYGVAGAVARAAECGLAARELVAGDAITREHGLELRAVVGAGEVAAVFVGGVSNRWELLLVGSAVAQIGSGAKLGQASQLIASPPAATLLDVRFGLRAIDGGAAEVLSCSRPIGPHARKPPVLPDAAQDALLTYVPAAVGARLLAGQTAWLGELRRVSVIFVNLPDWDESALSAVKRTQTVMRSMQQVLFQFEGSINKLSVDDKGVTLLAVMGLPPLAHEDDPLRAVRCAQLLQTRLREFSVRSAIGIGTGRVFCGSLGTERRREYTVIGAVVNLAARLMQSAPGDILCDEATHQAAATRLRFEPLPPLAVKGRAAPVPVFRPYSQVVADRTSRPMFGRAAERTALASRLDALTSGTSTVVLIEGEAGIGKSRLISELQREAAVRGIRTLAAAGDSIERTTTYHAWRPVFADVLGVEDFAELESRRRAVMEALGTEPELRRLAPLLNPLVAVELPETEFTEQMSGQARADNTNELLLRILEREARQQPLLIVVEDAHWMDSASQALTVFVARRLKPLLLAIGIRPLLEPVTPENAQLLAVVDDRFCLEPLGEHEIVRLVAQRLGVEHLPAEVAQLIARKAQGNPFFTEELAYALRDAGVLSISAGECTIPPGVDLDTVAIPDSVEGVVTGRIDRLPPTQQLTLKVASVIGRVFAYRILRDIHPIEPERERLIDHLAAFQRCDLASREPSEPDLSYVFKHAITQEVAYNLMLFTQRRQLHQAIAEWYEHRTAEGISIAPLLAHHWRAAGHGARALEWFERAGINALRTGAYAEALAFFDASRDLLPQTEDLDTHGMLRRVRIERSLAEASYGLGRLDATRDHCERVLRLLRRSSGATAGHRTIAVCRQLATQVYRRVGGGRNIASPAKREEALEASRAFEMLSFLRYFANDELGTMHATLAALNEAERAGSLPQLARTYAIVGFAAGLGSAGGIASYYLRKARQTAEATGLSAAIAWVHVTHALFGAAIADWDGAQRELREGIRIQEELGDRRRWIENMCLLSSIWHFQGRFQDRLELAQQISRVAEETGDIQSRAWACLDQIESLLPLAQHERTRELFERLAPLLRQNIGDAEAVWAGGLLARLHGDAGDRAAARQTATSVLEKMRRGSPTAVYTMEGYAAVAEVLVQQLEHQRGSEASAHDAVRQLSRFASRFPMAEPRLRRVSAALAWRRGSTRRAAALWQRARVLAERYRMPYELALVDYDVARYRGGADAPALLNRARAAFASIGAAREIDAIDRLVDPPARG